MKKILSILLIITMLFVCGACSNSSNNTTDTTESKKEEVNEYVMNSEEKALAELLIIASQIFKDPLSTKVKNIWVWKGSVSYYYTFELESKNGYGNMVSGYYGGMSLSGNLDNETLQKIDTDLSISGESMYFRKDQLTALQKGTQINSQCIPLIQEYFIKNYHD